MPIKPLNRKNVEFFPGHCGYVGSDFPVGGIMVLANNFSTLNGWNDYCKEPDRESGTPTWRKLRLMIAASGLPMEPFWFTNYCHGVMDRAKESYDFPHRIIKKLEFDRVFMECVEAMRPTLIVTLGNLPAQCIGTDFALRNDIESRTISGHQTRLLAAVHPSGWTWQGLGFSDDDFRREGERIGRAASA